MAPTPAKRLHADRQIAELLALGREIASPSCAYSEVAWKAFRTAYATLFRSTMEFLYNGGAALRDTKPGKKYHDIRLSDFLPGTMPPKPTVELKTRFKAADKLSAHLSAGRTQRGIVTRRQPISPSTESISKTPPPRSTIRFQSPFQILIIPKESNGICS